jgi:fructokinase
MTDMPDKRLCIFGEALFDVFPDGQQVLGGAPFNVAWHAQAFGLSPHFISRVGTDAAGERVTAAMRNWGMYLGGLQQDAGHPTGKVQVSLTADNEPAYDIVPDCAYDFIDAAAWPASMTCELLYHGTLALRSAVSRRAFEALKLQAGIGTFVDVNLRSPWWDTDTVAAKLAGVRWIKLNSHELGLLVPDAADLEEGVDLIMQRYAPELLIVTLGDAGALAVTRAGETARAEPDRQHAVVDTVGAGDALTSVILLGILRDWPLPLMLQRAQSFASAIVGVRGATVNDMAFYQPFLKSWELQ